MEDQRSSEHRYTWRHNCILLEIAKGLSEFVSEMNASPPAPSVGRSGIAFVKAGSKACSRRKGATPRIGILHAARDWSFDFHLPEWEKEDAEYVFPHDVAATARKPDGYIVSRQTKTCIVVELTAPAEENIQTWNTKKTVKYVSDIANQAERDWKVHIFALEVGAKGWIPPSYYRAFKAMGFSSKRVRDLSDKCQLVARKCSYLIWVNRFNKSFSRWRVCISQHSDFGARIDRTCTARPGLTLEKKNISRNVLEQKRQAAIARRDAKKALRLKDVILEKKKAAMARRKQKEAQRVLDAAPKRKMQGLPSSSCRDQGEAQRETDATPPCSPHKSYDQIGMGFVPDLVNAQDDGKGSVCICHAGTLADASTGASCVVSQCNRNGNQVEDQQGEDEEREKHQDKDKDEDQAEEYAPLQPVSEQFDEE